LKARIETKGEAVGRHYLSGKPTRVRWDQARITQIEEVAKAPDDTWIAPALVDLQVNGYAGIDFQQDDLTEEELIRASRGLRESGCTRFLLTLITDAWPKMTARLRHLRELREHSPELRGAVAGWHVEGPFLSQEPGFHGAHDPLLMVDPQEPHIRELREITGTDPVLLTLAPERPGALACIRLAASLGIRVSLGHTNAPATVIAEAVHAGARAFTHLGNGCAALLDRRDNILWRVFDTPGLKVSFIPDKAHVSAPLFRLAHRALDMDSIFYVSDAMAAAGAPPGRYRLGRLELDAGTDRVVRQPSSPYLAGSALEPLDGIRFAAEMLRGSWRECWKRYSDQPAGLMGLPGLVPGAPVNLCVIRTGPGESLHLEAAYAAEA
jgi:N-acetylglucosamine-6-phosphate deacetylase